MTQMPTCGIASPFASPWQGRFFDASGGAGCANDLSSAASLTTPDPSENGSCHFAGTGAALADRSIGGMLRAAAGNWSAPFSRARSANVGVAIASLALAYLLPQTRLSAQTYSATYSPLTQAEYFIDIDPGEGNGTPLALTEGDGLARDMSNVTVPVGSLPAGTHSVGMRVRDEANRWSNPLIRRFTVSTYTLAGGVDPTNPNAANLFPKPYQSLTQAEYFIDTDPGEGNGTPLALTESDGLARDMSNLTVPVGSLPAGTHSVSMRVRDEANRWSNPLIRRFTVSTFTLAGGVDPSNPNAANLFPKPYQSMTQAEYFVGSDPGEGNGVAFTFSGSLGVACDLSNVAIPLNLNPGSYTVGVRVKDEAGRWSSPLKRRFNLYSQNVIASQRSGTKLVDLEYDLCYGPRNYTVGVSISNDGGFTWSVPTGSVTGDVGANVTPGHSRKIVWHAGEDWNNGFSEDMRFRVVAYEATQDTPSGFVPMIPGSFSEGSPVDEIGRGTDEGPRTVLVNRPFFLKNSEVTWSEWNTVRNQCGTYGYTDIPAGQNGYSGDGSGNHPVTNVSWIDAVKWCNLRSEIEGKKPVYYTSATFNPATVVRTGLPDVYAFPNAGGYRLPTETEWEYACRAGTATAFHSGSISDAVTDANLATVGWYASNSGGNTHVVRGKIANARGVYDMHGNVREWCWDAYAAYASGPQWDPVSGPLGSMRVLRGGGWSTAAAACRSAARSSLGQNARGTDVGFRVAINYSGLTDVSSPDGIPIDSRDPASGNLVAGLRPMVNGTIHTSVTLPDGKILIGGDFTLVDNQSRNRLARLNPDGSLDTGFNPGADSTVYCAAVLADGSILLGGDFSTVANGPAEYIGRIHADGTLDTTFQSVVDYVVRCLLVQPDGKVVIGGDFGYAGGLVRNHIARLQADGAVDSTFNPNADGSVATIALQTDGKILLGGDFGTLGGAARSHLARVNADGTPDAAFTSGTDAAVTALVVQASGQIVVGGTFTSLGGQPRAGLGRLSASGVPDAVFNPGADGLVRCLAQQTDGRILVGGDFTTLGGSTRHRLASLTSDGVLEPAFALDFSGSVRSVNLLDSGRVVVAGSFGTVSGVTRQGMAWIDNSSPSETLSAMSGSRVRWLRGGSAPEADQVTFEVSTDGGTTWLPLGNAIRIFGGWEKTGCNLPTQGQLRARARIPGGSGNGSSALMTSVTNFSGIVTIPEIDVAIPVGNGVPDDGTHDFGTVTMGSNRSASFVIRNIGYGDLTGLTITKDGANPIDFQVTSAPVAPVQGPAGTTSLVVTFNPGDIGTRTATIHIVNNDANESPFDIHLTANAVIAGQLADGYDPTVNNRVNAMVVQPDGKVLIGGTFTGVGGVTRNRYARLNNDLSLESSSTFDTGTSGASGPVLAAAIQHDHKILIAGQFTQVKGQARPRIARILPDGAVDTLLSFNVPTGGPNNTVQTLALQADGKILIAGDFTSIGNNPAISRARIARLNADGSLDTTFLPGTGANATVNCLAVQADGRIVIGGGFTAFNGQGRQHLARLMPDGSLDAGFVPESDAKVSSLAIQPDGKIVLGGLFTAINGEPRACIARILPDGTVEDVAGFDAGSGADGDVTSIVLQADGSMLLGGAFTLFNDEPRAGIVRLYPNGTMEFFGTFDTVLGADLPVRGLALCPDGSVLAGGDFTDYNGSPRGRLALLANQPAVDGLAVSNSSHLDWNRSGTCAEIDMARFSLSTDGGTTWQALPAANRKSGGWQLSGLSLPSSGIIRAQGLAFGGMANASTSLIEKTLAFVNPPTLETLPASSIAETSALLNGTIVPNGSAQVWFEYGGTTGYGATTAVQTVSGNTLVELSVPLTNISGLYHFRIVAQTSGGIYRGSDLSLVTAPVPPIAVTANPVAVNNTSATLVGAVNPRGRETIIHFEYGSTILYGNTTSMQTVPAGNSAVEVTAAITGLAANATYHCRIVAENSAGKTYGSDVTFQATSGGTPTAAPTVVTGSAGELTTTTASLLGTVNPHGGFTNAFFEYGTSASLGSTSPALGAGNGTVPANLSWQTGSLLPGTIYHFRLVASNSLGTTQGEIHTFTTNFPPPVVAGVDVIPVGTTGARVSGIVRGSGTSAQVFLDFGTDGTSFPNSIGGAPAMVTGETETPVTADLTNLQQGVTYYYRLRAVNSGGTGLGTVGSFTPAILSGLTRQFPSSPTAATGSVTVNLLPVGIASGWRFQGERQWRASGATAGGMATGDRVIEFRPVAGRIQPPDEIAGIVSGEAMLVLDRDYYETESQGTGGVTVLLKPEDLAAGTVPAAQRAQWRFDGEDDQHWRDSGVMIGGLVSGTYLIECKPITGRTTPSLAEVRVAANQTTLASITYFIAPDPVGAAPVIQSFAEVSGNSSQPFGFVGQIRTNAGLGSGFVVKPRVVATAGHVVFDDSSMSFVSAPQWLFQRNQGTYEPKPLVPRGFYVFDGYETQRLTENTPGVSSPHSQNLDVAAMYFTEDAGRGGYSGFLASDTTTNEFLNAFSLKTLIGYPVDGVAANEQGRMFATNPSAFAFTPGYGRTHSTTAIRGAGGMSGGPLCVQHANGAYYPAAIFLGGTAQTVVRAIDSAVIDLFNRAQVSGDGGDNNTGGGITYSEFSPIGSSGDPGALVINIQPAAARNAGAGWRLKPETSYRDSGFQKNNLKAGSYILQLKTVDGFGPPTQQSIIINGGKLSEYTFTYAPSNTAPTISAIANRTINEDESTGSISFSVGDAETSAVSLTATCSSSNTTLVPVGNIVFGGSGANRTVTVTPAANQNGTSTVTLTIGDGDLSSSESFTLTVNPVNDMPTIAAIGDQDLALNTATKALAFVIGDVETAASSLLLGRDSSNTTLVPVGNISLGGSGANRTVIITPVSGQLGSSFITLTVGDGNLTASRIFSVTVTGTPQETWRFENYGTANNTGSAADTADPDGDGTDNLYEYTAGTDPNNPADVFRILSASRVGGAFTVTIHNKVGRIYTLERSAAPSGSGWGSIQTSGPFAIAGEVTLEDAAPPSGNSFYRIRVVGP